MNGALKTWQEKLDYLQEQEAIAADPAQKFTLQQQIKEAKAKIAELKRKPKHTRAKEGKPSARVRLRAYLRWLINECAPLRLNLIQEGTAGPGKKPLGLASVYVDLNVELRLPVKVPLVKHLAQIAKGDDDQRNPAGRALTTGALEKETRLVAALEALAAHEALVLLGAPGTGKSTLVAYVAMSLAQAALKEKGAIERLGAWWPAGALIPVRVVLRHFAASLPAGLDQGRAHHLWDFIRAEMHKSGLGTGTADDLCEVAQGPGALFLFDGLDEAREESARARVLEAVDEFTCTAGEKCRYLLTSRPYAWTELADTKALPTRFAERCVSYKLADFLPDQIRQFIEHWYAAIGALGWVGTADARQKTQDLIGAVRRPDLEVLARNPLFRNTWRRAIWRAGRIFASKPPGWRMPSRGIGGRCWPWRRGKRGRAGACRRPTR